MQEDNQQQPLDEESFHVQKLIDISGRLLVLVAISLTFVIVVLAVQLAAALGWFSSLKDVDKSVPVIPDHSGIAWRPPSESSLPDGDHAELIRYGRELIVHTAVYLGPKGKVAKVSNGLNCQNCHLVAGTKPFAANYSRVASTYPKFRERSGTVEGFEKRVNDCIERSLNGVPLDEDSREIQAIIAYMKWLGSNAPANSKDSRAGFVRLAQLSRAADPAKGRPLYLQICASCHGENGQGLMDKDKIEWVYPPLWGENSYNTGAGLYRISKFAAFIKANMPYGVSFDSPVLTDEQAWDIAAYVNSRPRPHKEFPMDWPVLSSKPVDHPFGPYADAYSEEEHKYGPFGHMQSKQAP